jgi:glutamyl endopeptidase
MDKTETVSQTGTIDSVIGKDDRVEVTDTKKPPYSAICALWITWPDGTPELGTGYIFGPRTVFTAGHNLYSRRKRTWAASIKVVPGQSRGLMPFGSVEVRSNRLRAYPIFVDGNEKDADFNDFGCIVLPTPLGESTKWSDLAPAEEVTVGHELIVTGYPVEKVNGTSVPLMTGRGKVLEREGSFIAYNADATGGQSGAPIWRATDHFPYVMICGFHKGEANVGKGNFAVMLNWQHYDWVQARMRETG